MPTPTQPRCLIMVTDRQGRRISQTTLSAKSPAQLARLVERAVRSLARPDVYVFRNFEYPA